MQLTISPDLSKDDALKMVLALVSNGGWRDGSNILKVVCNEKGRPESVLLNLVTNGVTDEFVEVLVMDMVERFYRPLEEHQRTDHLIAEAKNAAREFSGGPVLFNPHSELLGQLADEIESLRVRLAEALAVPAEYLADGDGSRPAVREKVRLHDELLRHSRKW